MKGLIGGLVLMAGVVLIALAVFAINPLLGACLIGFFVAWLGLVIIGA